MPSSLNIALGFMGEPWPTNTKLHLAAAKCQLDNELYDLRMPGYYSENDEWIPKSEYLGLSSKNARENKLKYQLGFSPEDWSEAYRYYGRFSIEKLEEEIACLEREANL